MFWSTTEVIENNVVDVQNTPVDLLTWSDQKFQLETIVDTCESCGKIFKNKLQLKDHQFEIHNRINCNTRWKQKTNWSTDVNQWRPGKREHCSGHGSQI